MSLSKEEKHKLSPYAEVNPIPQNCTHCGALTTPRIITKTANEKPTFTVQEAHWICGRCNNRFYIGRLK